MKRKVEDKPRCPCGHAGRSDNVARHKTTCKVLRDAQLAAEAPTVEALQQALAAKDILLSAANEEVERLKAQVQAAPALATRGTTNRARIVPFRTMDASGQVEIRPRKHPAKALVLPLLQQPWDAAVKYLALKYFSTDRINVRLVDGDATLLELYQEEPGGARWVREEKQFVYAPLATIAFADLAKHYAAQGDAKYRRWYHDIAKVDEWLWNAQALLLSRSAIWETLDEVIARKNA